MDTITERAKEHREFCRNNGGRYNDYSYYLGATEQREIDIQHACDWLQECLPNIEYITNASALRQNKQQFIESFKRAMKGE